MDMYQNFFQLSKLPFSMTPDPSFLYMTARHREALAGLLYATATRKGFLVLTGDVGTGKTTLLRRMLASSPSSQVHFSFVLNPTLTPSEFLEMALTDFGLDDIPASKAARLVRFQQFLLQTHQEGRTAALVVDEAHMLTPQLLEEIRLLTNFETAEQKLLQIILAGQPELSALLNRQDMRQLKQRIAVWVNIGPLHTNEIEPYIKMRWQRAGAKSPLPFTADAIAAISAASHGIPRIINGICDNALTNAFGAEQRSIGRAQIYEVLEDMYIATPAGEAELSQEAAAGPAPEPVADKPPSKAPLTFKALERYMPAQKTQKFWPSWFGLS